MRFRGWSVRGTDIVMFYVAQYTRSFVTVGYLSSGFYKQ